MPMNLDRANRIIASAGAGDVQTGFSVQNTVAEVHHLVLSGKEKAGLPFPAP